MANRNIHDMDKQKVALVLSMGGARGIAHIGVIEELLRHNFEITSIAGSSMGAMVGAMYASGKMEECKGHRHLPGGEFSGKAVDAGSVWFCDGVNLPVYDVY